jgi:hypothetical protein
VDHGIQLANQAQLASWPTPQAGTPTQNGYNEAGGTDFSRKVEVIVGLRETVNGPKAPWGTPRASDAMIVGPTDSNLTRDDGKLEQQTAQAVFGTTPSGLPERTERRGGSGALNPQFVCWMMGFGIEWLMCAQNGLRKP